MRILLIAQEYPPDTAHGGIGSQTYNKARALVARGHEVHVLTASADDTATRTVTQVQAGVVVHRAPNADSELSVHQQPTYWLGYTWIVLRELERLRTSVDFDVVDVPEYGAEGFAYLLDRGPHNFLPVVVQLHGPLAMFSHRIGWPEVDSDFYRVGTFMEDHCIRRADALMACSANIAEFTAVHHGVDRARIHDVLCGVDAEAFAPPAAGPRAEEEDATVLFVGNIAPNKGVDTVLDAVLALRDRHPRLRLDVLGTASDASEAILRARAEAAGHPDALRLLGFAGRDEMPGHYRRATVFSSPALHEVGVANVYIEAMACGAPVLAANTGGAPEAVRDGESGLLVPPRDPAAAAAALDRLLSDPALRARMGAAGRARVEDHFAMDRYLDRVLAVYEEAIERAGRRLAEGAWA